MKTEICPYYFSTIGYYYPEQYNKYLKITLYGPQMCDPLSKCGFCEAITGLSKEILSKAFLKD